MDNDNLGGSGIGVIITANHVNTSNDIWHINPSTQDGTDIQLQMNSEWGFHPSTQSTIHLTIDGFTPNITKTDGEFLILFGVTNYYFSIVIRLEDKTAWKSYPNSNSTHSLAYTNNIFMDLILTTQSIENRWNRISNNDQWTNIGHPNLYKKALKWPLKLSVTNDPINDKVYYQCYLHDRILSAVYNSAFPVDEGLSVYIMNDASDGKPFDIYGINVTYSYMTDSPTISPSMGPTQQPSVPTLTPTLSPTNRVLIVPGDDNDNDNDIDTNEDNDNGSDQNVNNGVSTTRDPLIDYKADNDREDVVIIDDHNDTLYIVVIIVLGVLLCIVSIALIYKWLKSNRTYLNAKPGNKVNEDRVKSPKSPKSISNSINKYLQKQLAESIANSSGANDSPERGNRKKPFVIIPGARSAAAASNGSHSGSDTSDSDEELYEQGSMHTETTTFTNGYRRDSRRNISTLNDLGDLNIMSIMSVINDENDNDNDKGNEGTPDETLNIDIRMDDEETDNDNMDGNESENETTIALPMNPVTYV